MHGHESFKNDLVHSLNIHVNNYARSMYMSYEVILNVRCYTLRTDFPLNKRNLKCDGYDFSKLYRKKSNSYCVSSTAAEIDYTVECCRTILSLS